MKDIYVKFAGSELQGESTDTKHQNEIEALSFSHRILQPRSSTASTAGGHTAERTEHGEMIFTKSIDKATGKLMRACSAGTVYKDCVITFYRAYGGKDTTATSQQRVPYLVVKLEDVVVSTAGLDIADGDELPAENVGLRYGKVTWEYSQHKMDGSSAKVAAVGWDLRSNTAV
jgi:type VI secretion system secreted protein Hcp